MGDFILAVIVWVLGLFVGMGIGNNKIDAETIEWAQGVCEVNGGLAQMTEYVAYCENGGKFTKE